MFSRLTLIVLLASLLGACAHPITINPLETPAREEASLSSKKVAYVMTDADRAKEVITEGGGGDKVSYFPYRDLEKAIRDGLRAVYSDVSVVKSPSDSAAIKGNDIAFVFVPEISTSSNSPSPFTWPPTEFNIDLSCKVMDPAGNTVSQVKAAGKGAASFSEFKSDFGLSGRRAATELSKNLKQQVSANQQLR